MSFGEVMWQSYEELVKDIYMALGQMHGVSVEGWGWNCKIVGKSGALHQVDVLTKHGDGLHEYRTAIECKYWNKKVSKEAITKLKYIVEDASISKGIVVSKMGFTDSAKAVALDSNIGLVELREPLDSDWKGRVREFCFKINLKRIRLKDVQFHCRGEVSSGDILESMFSNDIYVNLAGSGRLICFDDVIIEPVEGRRSRIDFDDGSFIVIPKDENHRANGCGIVGVSYDVVFDYSMLKEWTVNVKDCVYMIMESIFDNRHYTLTVDGVLHEDNLYEDDFHVSFRFDENGNCVYGEGL